MFFFVFSILKAELCRIMRSKIPCSEKRSFAGLCKAKSPVQNSDALQDCAKQNPLFRKAELCRIMRSKIPCCKSGALQDYAKQNPLFRKAELCGIVRSKISSCKSGAFGIMRSKIPCCKSEAFFERKVKTTRDCIYNGKYT